MDIRLTDIPFFTVEAFTSLPSAKESLTAFMENGLASIDVVLPMKKPLW